MRSNSITISNLTQTLILPLMLLSLLLYLTRQLIFACPDISTKFPNRVIHTPVDLSGLQFIGGYQGLAAANSFVHPFWNDARVGIQDIFTAAIPSAQPGAD